MRWLTERFCRLALWCAEFELTLLRHYNGNRASIAALSHDVQRWKAALQDMEVQSR